jgi:hypothetical protein
MIKKDTINIPAVPLVFLFKKKTNLSKRRAYEFRQMYPDFTDMILSLLNLQIQY